MQEIHEIEEQVTESEEDSKVDAIAAVVVVISIAVLMTLWVASH